MFRLTSGGSFSGPWLGNVENYDARQTNNNNDETETETLREHRRTTSKRDAIAVPPSLAANRTTTVAESKTRPAKRPRQSRRARNAQARDATTKPNLFRASIHHYGNDGRQYQNCKHTTQRSTLSTGEKRKRKHNFELPDDDAGNGAALNARRHDRQQHLGRRFACAVHRRRHDRTALGRC
jgi:hypothetical protein